jgi:hypothetical protein
MSNHVYHFTDTIRLPWIIETGELRPDSNRIGGFPADFLWTTSNDKNDLTSSAAAPSARRAYREHVTQLVRVTQSRRLRAMANGNCGGSRMDA